MHNDKDEQLLLETVGDAIGRCLPDRIQKSEPAGLWCGRFVGFVTGWLVVKKAAELLFGKDEKK